MRGIYGRLAGSVAGFRYSSAMAKAGLVWNEATLDAFLAAPAQAIPGTSKSRGVANPQDRADIIAYLKTLTEPLLAAARGQTAAQSARPTPPGSGDQAEAGRAPLAFSTIARKASGSAMASSDRTLRSISIPAFDRPSMKRE